jgi:hypothetical protein
MNRKARARGFGAIAIGGWFIFISVMLIWGALNDIRQDQATLLWPSTPGNIARMSYARVPLDAQRTWGCQYEVSLAYAYEVGGRRYQSDSVRRTRKVVCSAAATLNKVLGARHATIQ